MRIHNIFQLGEHSLGKEEIFETLCKDERIHIERIISSGQKSQPDTWYQEENNEFVVLLKGRASLEFENGKIIHLTQGDHILIPSGLKHRVSYTSKMPHCIWLAVHFKSK